MSTHDIRIGERNITYQVRRGRGRHIRLTVRGDEGLVAYVPKGVRLAAVEGALHRHAGWIVKMVEELEAARRCLFGADRPRTLWHGQWLELHFTAVNEVVHDDGRLLVPSRSKAETSTLLRRWYRRCAVANFRQLAASTARELDVNFSRLQVREQKTRWGSFSSKGTLSLNWRLLMAPPEVCGYVVVHELVHARHMNHSRRFWELVVRYSPDYKHHIRWLQKHRILLEMLSTFAHVDSAKVSM